MSGCINLNGNEFIELLDGTKVTGDIEKIQIIDYELIKERKLFLKNQWENTTYFIN